MEGELREYLETLPQGSIIYSEQAHWGFYIDAPDGLHFTSYPVIGLMEEDGDLQDRATTAIRADDIDTLHDLGIQYAVTSPMGLLAPTLLESDFWQVITRDDGMRLWGLIENNNGSNIGILSAPKESDCREPCQWRPDIWSEHRWWNHSEISSHRAFLNQGSISWSSVISTELNHSNVELELFFDAPSGITVEFSTAGGSKSLTSKGGWQSVQITVQVLDENMMFTVSVQDGGQLWLNPSGLTGRGDRLFDETGVRVHWVEITSAT